VAEVLFYRLTRSPIEVTLPDLLEKSLARGWRVLVRAGSEAGLAMLDDGLWTWREGSFLPHGRATAPEAARQPILLTLDAQNLNGAHLLMLVLGARAGPEEMAAYARACLLFDGSDEAATEAARADWRAVTEAGLPARFWAEEDGRWVQKASN
jgi:DNA polymerase III subunit chi